MLNRETFTGPWAGVPVAWTDDDRFDETTYRTDVARCCEAGVPGVYTAGTTGEFYAMEFDEWKAVTLATVKECQAQDTPAMIGCTSTFTLGVERRAAYAAEVGADAIQVALPFWMEISDEQIVPFFKSVAAASGGLPLSIYETTRAKKVLSIDQHRAIKEAVPRYWVVKANSGTVGCSPEGCQALSEFVNVFVSEQYFGKLGPAGARGSCSAMVYWNPRLILSLWQQVQRGDWASVDAMCSRLTELVEFLVVAIGARGLTDTAFDRLGGTAGGFLGCGLRGRGPYPSATPDDVETLRRWYRAYFPDMLVL